MSLRTQGPSLLPPEKDRRRRWVRWLLILAVLVIATAGVLWWIFREEIRAGAEVARTVSSARQFVNESVPALERDFPFDPSGADLSLDRLKRYLRVREAMADRAGGLLDKATELTQLRIESGRPRDILKHVGARQINDLAPELRALGPEIESALRAERMSVEEFRWTAAQVWGQTALAARRGNPEARREIEALADQLSETFGVTMRTDDPEHMADELLKNLGKGFEEQDPALWSRLAAVWQRWSGRPDGRAVDLVLVRFWPDIRKNVEKLNL